MRRNCPPLMGPLSAKDGAVELELISDQPTGLGFPHLAAGRCQPDKARFSSPVRRRSRYMERPLDRGWDPIFPRWSWIIYQHHPIRDRPVGLGLHTVRGGINPDNNCVCPRIFVVEVRMHSDPGMRPYRPRVSLTLCTSPGQ